MRILMTVALVALGAILATGGGCAGTRHAGPAIDAAHRARSLTLHTRDGGRGSWDAMIAAAADADVVFLGEVHDHPLGLPFQLEVWRDVLAKRPGATLSMEFMERDEQAAVDDYLTGVTTLDQFLKKTQRTEKNYPAAHREMVELAKSGGRPVIASNAPRPYVRLVRHKGLDALDTLTAEQRRLVRKPDEIATGRYREDFGKAMGEGNESPHGGKTEPEVVDAMFRSQQTWDWTMAESIARGLDAGGKPVVQVVGRFHCEFDGGLVQALRKLRPDVRVVVIGVHDEPSDVLKDDDKGAADYLIYAGPGAD